MSNNNEPNKIIFSMVGVSKFHDKKPILKNIYLSFFYGAKIGVLGLNGSGKSSLLRIIAGQDKDINGEVVFSQGYSIGFLEQEPKLDESKTVRQTVEEAVQETVNLLQEFDEINLKFGEEMSTTRWQNCSNGRAKCRNAWTRSTLGIWISA
jgi:ATPase subunit of ABC transporter with duplicated ATPase domains